MPLLAVPALAVHRAIMTVFAVELAALLIVVTAGYAITEAADGVARTGASSPRSRSQRCRGVIEYTREFSFALPCAATIAVAAWALVRSDHATRTWWVLLWGVAAGPRSSPARWRSASCPASSWPASCWPPARPPSSGGAPLNVAGGLRGGRRRRRHLVPAQPPGGARLPDRLRLRRQVVRVRLAAGAAVDRLAADRDPPRRDPALLPAAADGADARAAGGDRRRGAGGAPPSAHGRRCWRRCARRPSRSR